MNKTLSKLFAALLLAFGLSAGATTKSDFIAEDMADLPLKNENIKIVDSAVDGIDRAGSHPADVNLLLASRCIAWIPAIIINGHEFEGRCVKWAR